MLTPLRGVTIKTLPLRAVTESAGTGQTSGGLRLRPPTIRPKAPGIRSNIGGSSFTPRLRGL